MSRPPRPTGGSCADIPEVGGVYAFVLRQPARDLSIRVGALGAIGFVCGYYCYVGSARRNLRARLSRHLRTRQKRLHWHIDYLRPHTEPAGVVWWLQHVGGTECGLSRQVARLADASVPGFGCSDCSCASHLHYFADDPIARLRRIRMAGRTSE